MVSAESSIRRRRPWVDVDAADPDAIARTIVTCPTGALHFRRLDGGAHEEAAAETTVEPPLTGRYLCAAA